MNNLDLLATVLFAIAIIHTFSVKKLQHMALKYPEGSAGENFFHLIGEVEVVFGFWAAIFIMFYLAIEGKAETIQYLEGRNFTEPLFVFVIMTICSSRPILEISEKILFFISKLIPIPKTISFYLTTLTVGPILGSFITEPAAMTITASVLLDQFYKKNISKNLKYATLGLLFVSVSIGGTLTPYAAPPILMVANQWGWDISFMLTHFGFKSITSILISTLVVVIIFNKELKQIQIANHNSKKTPLWVYISHLFFLIGIVLTSHHPVIFIGIFLFFMGLYKVTNEYQTEIKLKEALLVGFFLAGLIVIGSPQKWWLQPLISHLNDHLLYFGSMALTAITDNAALTYLGSLVEGLSESSKIFLVSGSVIGGGLTVIANAPNPAGYGILNSSFGEEGISPLGLLAAAVGPTLIASIIFLVF